jgi:hypothetical protein
MTRRPHDPSRAKSRPRYTRRLSDKILIAFHHACDQEDLEVAAWLLDVLESLTRRPYTQPIGTDQEAKEGLIAAHERLWKLRRPEAKWSVGISNIGW